MKVRVNNELLDWLLFFLKGVEQTAEHSIEILNEVLDLKTNLTQTIRGNTGNRANKLTKYRGIKILPTLPLPSKNG
jgi:hypothetical protein